MANTSLVNLRKLMSQSHGDYQAESTTSASTSTTSIISSDIGHERNDFFNQYYIRRTSGASSTNTRVVTDFITTSGSVIVSKAFSGSSSSSETFELHKINPDHKDDAIKESLRETYPFLSRSIINSTLVGGNPLPNSNFEDWASASNPDKWAVLNVTVAQNGTAGNFRWGKNSAAITRSGTDGHLFIGEDQWSKLLDMENSTVTFFCWVRCDTASTSRLQVYTKTEDGTETTTNSDFHSGGDEFELLSKDINIPDNLSDIEFRITVETNDKIVFADNAYVLNMNVFRYLIPAQFARFPTRVYFQADDNADSLGEEFPWLEVFDYSFYDDGTDKYIQFETQPINRHKIILEGRGYLTQPSTDADTTEIGEPETKALIAYANFLLFDRIVSKPGREDVSRWDGLSQRYLRRWHDLRPKAIRAVAMKSRV